MTRCSTSTERTVASEPSSTAEAKAWTSESGGEGKLVRAAGLKKSGGVLLSQGPSDQPPEEVTDDNAPDTGRLLQSDQAT